MAGSLLVSGSPQQYKAIGEAGQPVYSVAFQLREAVRLKAGAEVANCLAIPQRNEKGDVIDWYAPERGDVVPWSAATPEEREHALLSLDAAHSKLVAAIEQLAEQRARSELAQREKDTVMPLLSQVFFFPDPSLIFLVNGKPVLTFWGFQPEGSTLPRDPFVTLRPVLAPPPSAVTPIAVRRRAWWWWLLLLLALVLLLLLLNRCGIPQWVIDATPTLTQTQEAPRAAVPPAESPAAPVARATPAAPERRVEVIGGQGVLGSGVTGTGPVTSATPQDAQQGSNATGVSEGQSAAGVSGQESGNTERTNPERPGTLGEGTASANPSPASTPTQTNPSRSEQNRDQSLPQANPSAAGTPGNNSAQPGNPLLIPDAALSSGSTRFLDGSWSAGAGIQDAATGRPVRLEYDFSQGNGQGRVTVKRGDGVQCTGNAAAQVQGRSVQINDRGVAKCSDGSTVALPKVTCTPGAGNQATCQGQYDNGTSFPVSMRHAPK